MGGGNFDCVVVGARCAGSPLAAFLARAGKRVLVVDAASFPSDQPMSTHFIQPCGMRILDELGLGDRVREIAPPVTNFVNGVGEHVIELVIPAGGSCPRRTELDALLLEGAREAGAEVRLKCKVVEVIKEGDRVCGVIVDEDGQRSEIRAGIVVGADGRHSTVAGLVGAEEYYAYDGPRCAYWAYFPRPASYATSPDHRGAAIILHNDDDLRFVFPVNKDQLIIGMTFPNTDDVSAWKKDPEGQLIAAMRAHPVFAPLVEEPPLSKVLGLVKIRFFFRRAAGPGWALVGDAGLFKDPTPGLGITDAFRDAKALAAAIVEGGDAALERYWRKRDVDSLELFHFARDLGEVNYNNPLNQLVFAKSKGSPALRQRFIEVIERQRSPYDAFTVGEILRWTFGAMLRGRFSHLKPFFRAGKVAGFVKKELQQRQRLAQRALSA
ncbi:hypothetical protein BH11MYX3_BH11MYX3_34830 [soil metagenome]